MKKAEEGVKKLSEMTLEELWQLFPISLTEHQPCWKEWFEQEAKELRSVLPPDGRIRLNHIGSTSVEGIWAKPIVDILLEIPKELDMRGIEEILLGMGYLCMSREEGRISFNKGYTENGFAERVFHLHVRYLGDHDELYFRDYLRKHADAAREYEKLKLSLWKKYEHDRDGYTAAKTEFVLACTERAKQEA